MFSKKKKGKEDEILEVTDNQDIALAEDTFDLEEEDATPVKKKLPGWVIFPILGGVVVVSVLVVKLAGGKETSTAAPLAVTEAVTGTVKEVYNASGTIESENTKTFFSPVTAPISNCNVKVGQTVKAGELLITYDTTNLERDNQQAQLSLQSSRNTSQATREKQAQAIDAANAASADLANQANALADQLNTLGAQVDAAWNTYQANQNAAAEKAPEIQTKRTDLQKQIAELEGSIQTYQNTIDRVTTGYNGRRAEAEAAAKKPVTEQTNEEKALIAAFADYDTAIANLDSAQKKLASANAELNSLSNDVDDAGYPALKAEYDALYPQWEAAYNAANSSGSANAGMTGAESANLNISDNMAELSALTPAELVAKGKEGIKADMDGVIASVDALAGTSATQGGPLLTIASLNDVRVKIEVSPDDYSKMKTGNAATITIGEKKYEGTLTKVNKIALENKKGNPVIGAEISINNPDADICIGATAKVTMTVAESKNVLIVPTEAINTSSEGDFVYVIENGTVISCPVEIGTASTMQVEIKSGLKKGAQVVNDLNVNITEGMKATPLPADNGSKTDEDSTADSKASTAATGVE